MLLSALLKGHLPQLVMFDLDGTLIDSVPDLATAIDRMLSDCNAQPVGEHKVRGWVGNGALKLVQRALHDAALPAIDEGYALERFLLHYREVCTLDTRLYEGVVPFLTQLSALAIPMVIVTNKPSAYVAPILRSLEVDHYFNYCLGGDDLPHKKPHPEPLLHCLKRFDCHPTRALMVGDSVNDIVAAQRAGVAVIAVDYGYNGGQPVESSQPSLVVSSLNDVLCE